MMKTGRFIITMAGTESKHIVDCDGGSANCDGVVVSVTNTAEPGVYDVTIDNQIIPVYIKSDGISVIRFSIRGYQYEARVLAEGDQYYFDMISSSPAAVHRSVRISTPMPGLLKHVLVSNGENVRKGDTLFTLEAMKMENAIISPIAGMIKDLTATAGQTFEKGSKLCVVEPIL